jgi:hypothetical protein
VPTQPKPSAAATRAAKNVSDAEIIHQRKWSGSVLPIEKAAALIHAEYAPLIEACERLIDVVANGPEMEFCAWRTAKHEATQNARAALRHVCGDGSAEKNSHA